MEKRICRKCKKVIEGYSKKHVMFLMMQHQMMHKNDKAQKKLRDNKK